MDPIRILHVVPNMNNGGIENLIMNLYRNIDRSLVQFDFLVHYKKRCFFDDEIEKLGGKIYRFSVCEDYNLIKYKRHVSSFFREHPEYKVVHGHMASLAYFYLGAAKKNGVKIRIVHSHGTSHLKNLKGYIKYVLFKGAKKNANVYYACSTEAGKYLFGNKKFEFIPNAIDLEKYDYNEEIRKQTRNQLKIKKNTLVLINVARFNLQKNHIYLIEIFKELKKLNNDSILLLAGDGETRNDIESKIKEYNLEDSVYLLGVRSDVDKLYQASDIFILPSLFEGLPVTGVEAQASKIKCFFSSEITREVIISENTHFISINEKPSVWAKEIVKNMNYDRKNQVIEANDFNIKTLSKNMELKYISFYNE